MTVTETPKDLIRAACYCRISSDQNDKREGVDRQRTDTAMLCEAKGWTPVGFYIDNDRSASNGKAREEWDRLLADITAGKIDAIAVWNQDRGWRQMSELEELRKFFTSLDRRVLLTTTLIGDIDLYDPYGVYAAQNRTAASELETAVMKVRMKRAAKAKAEQGRPQWKRAFGYLPDTRRKEDDDGMRVPDPVTAPLVNHAYAAILAGAPLREIATMFNDAGAYGLTGKPWTESTVSLFLRAPRNAGLRSHNDKIVGQATWPGLVTESVWQATQNKLNAPGRAPGRKSVRKHPLTGVLLCGKPGCDGYLAGRWVMRKTGGKSGRPKAGQQKEPHDGQMAHLITYSCKSCRGVAVRAEHIESFLRQLAGGRLAMPDAVDLTRAEVEDPAEVERINAELLGLKGKLDKFVLDYENDLLTGQQLKTVTDNVNEKIAKLKRHTTNEEIVKALAGIRVGQQEAVDDVENLSVDRFRTVLNVLGTVTVMPVGKGQRVFNPDRVQVNWR